VLIDGAGDLKKAHEYDISRANLINAPLTTLNQLPRPTPPLHSITNKNLIFDRYCVLFLGPAISPPIPPCESPTAHRLQKQILVVAKDVSCDLAIEVAQRIASQYPEHVVRGMIAGDGSGDIMLHMATYR
jgi:hypothetical protein